MNKACYRKLRRYKYQLTDPYVLDIGISGYTVTTPYLRLGTDGVFAISKGYAWDGPSGPTFDTLNFMRGSLVHDALYQLIRLKSLAFCLQALCRLVTAKTLPGGWHVQVSSRLCLPGGQVFRRRGGKTR